MSNVNSINLNADGETISNKKLTDFPSIDKPWLKYYSEEAINAPLSECTMYELMYENNKKHLDDIALIYYNREITYGQLFNEIEKTAKAFSALGVKQGDIVIICSANMPETIYIIYALNRLGAVINLVDPRANEEQLRKYINECNSKIVVSIDLAYPTIKKAVKNSTAEQIVVISPSDSFSTIMQYIYKIQNKANAIEDNTLLWNDFRSIKCNSTSNFVGYEKNQLAVIGYTGGTTGIPKGVCLSNDNVNAVVHGYRYVNIPFKRQDTYYNDLPPFIIYGLSLAIHTTLCYGLRVILEPLFNPKRFPKEFAKKKPNHFSAGADHLNFLKMDKKVQKMNLSFLKTPAMGGDSLNIKTEEEVNNFLQTHGCYHEVVKGFGMTELSATAITTFDGVNELGSIGVPLVNNMVKFVDTESGKEVGYNQVGEMWISGPSVMMGYYNNLETTEEIIVEDENGNRWIRTGDLGCINEDGLIFHKGRIRRIYVTVVDGQPAKIFPMLIENTIKTSSDVYDCVVVGRHMEDSSYYETVAYVILKDNCKRQEYVLQDLQKLCKDNIPSYMRPIEYRFVTKYPHTSIGKVDFRKLEEMATEKL